jgi:hypothetical protein
MNSPQRPELFRWIFLLRRTAILLQGSRQKGTGEVLAPFPSVGRVPMEMNDINIP